MIRSLSLLLLSTLSLSIQATVLSSAPVVAYVDQITYWWGCNVPAGIGMPSASTTGPNVIALSFWLSTGPVDAAGLWADLTSYIPTNCGYGTTTAQMQQALIQQYHANGIQVIVSAFGSTDYPTSKNATQVCTSLAQFVLANNLDGVDLDYEDTGAFSQGVGAQWLITCTQILRQYLPQGQYILTHAPQGPYFTTAKAYPDGAYLTIDKQVGQLIDWYNLQYYNQGTSVYTTYQDTFVSCSAFPGTAVLQLSGLNSKIAVGKPVTTNDAGNGWISASTLAGWLVQANQQAGWCGGAMYWELSSDTNGTFGASMKQALASFTNCGSSQNTSSSNSSTKGGNSSNGTTNSSNSTTNSSNSTTNSSNSTTNSSNGTTNSSNSSTQGGNSSNGKTNSSNGTTNSSNGTTNSSNGTKNSSNGTKNSSNGTTNSSNSSTQGGNSSSKGGLSILSSAPVVAYADQITYWWGCNVPAGVGMPSAPTTGPNVIALSFWLSTTGPADAASLWADLTSYIPTNCGYGTTTAQMQQALIQQYHANGIKVIVSAFGSTDYPTSKNATQVCTSLAQFVLANNLDGVDLDYEDTGAFSQGVGAQWLITCTKVLRQYLPQGQYILTHAPQGPYFTTASTYPDGAYLTIDKQVGQLIDWYNLQYYNQGTSVYTTYQDTFVSCSAFPGTAVLQLSGLNSKIAVGKPVTTNDAGNGWISASTLAGWLVQANQQAGWCGGAMYWELSSDTNGTFGASMKQALASFTNCGSSQNTSSSNSSTKGGNSSNGTTNSSNSTTNSSNSTTNSSNSTTNSSNGTTNSSNSSTQGGNSSNGKTNSSNGTTNSSNGTTNSSNGTKNSSNGTKNSSNGTTNSSNSSTQGGNSSSKGGLSILSSAPVVAYADQITYWWGCNVPAGVGMPSAPTTGPNVIALSFWLSTTGPADAASLWADLTSYIPTNCGYGTTTAQMQQALIQQYHANGIKVIVSAFGSTDYPTSKNATQVCTSLAQFVLANNLDGVDLDYEDTGAFSQGVGAQWLITCTKVLRQYLPQGQYILTHAPQGPYFTTASTYPDGAYLTIDKQVGQLIDWYNLQYYNQGTSVYTTYQDTFVSCSAFPGTAVLQLSGLNSKIAVGKPVTTNDAGNGWISASTLAGWLVQANQQAGWCGGAMYWELSSDTNGTFGASMKQALASFTNCGSSQNTSSSNSSTKGGNSSNGTTNSSNSSTQGGNSSNGTTNSSNSSTNSSNGTKNSSNGTTNSSNGTTNSSNGTKNSSNGTSNSSNGTTNSSNSSTQGGNSSNGTTNSSNSSTNSSNGTTNSSNSSTQGGNSSNSTTNTSNSTTNSSSNSTSKGGLSILSSAPVVAYVDQITSWWGCNVPAGIGMPSAPTTGPNVIAISFWLSTVPVDAAGLWADLTSYIPTNCGYGTTTAQMQQALIQQYHANGIKVIVSAFGSTDYPTSKNATQVCTSLAQFVLANNLDGVDLDYEDTGAFSQGVGAQWLITCTKVLRQYLPQGQYILTHAPQGPYFTTASTYPDGAYLTIDKQVGQLIDWYNLQYYNQGTSVYTTYQDTFVSCSAFPGTAVLQLSGLNSKIAVGKPVTTNDAGNGWISASTLAGWLVQANQQAGWCGGAMYWELSSDTNGTFGASMKQALASFTNCGSSQNTSSSNSSTKGGNSSNGTTNSSNSTTNSSNGTTNSSNSSTQGGNSSNGTTNSSNSSTNSSNGTTNSSNSSTQGSNSSSNSTSKGGLSILSSAPVVTYVDQITSWWGCNVPAGIGMPSAPTTGPNVIAISFWLSTGPVDVAGLWADLTSYIPTNCGYGTTTAQMQQALIQQYHANGIKVIVSAFGSTDYPTSKNATQVCTSLAQFVLANNLDGVDLDYEDTGAFSQGVGAQWLITCTQILRQYLPQGQYILTHAPQGPYFTTAKAYPDGAYLTIDKQVGQLIDWYNLQYYNQGTSVYTTYQDTFVSCSAFPGTAVLQLSGLNSKIAVGKPVTTNDAGNGWISASTLAGWLVQANQQAGWCGGAMYWELSSDTNGTFGASMKQALASFSNCNIR